MDTKWSAFSPFRIRITEDPVAAEAAKDGVKVFKYKSWRKKGVVLPEVLEEYKSIDANINVMPFCSQFIPME